jgi:hypothetical protein
MSTAYVYTDLLRRRHIVNGSVRVRLARRDRFGVGASAEAGIDPEAPRSTRANRLVNYASTFLMTGGRLAARSSLGLNAASRDAALAAARPARSFSVHRRPPPATGRRCCPQLHGVWGDPVRVGRLPSRLSSRLTAANAGPRVPCQVQHETPRMSVDFSHERYDHRGPEQ